jgi:hypothetical protein
MSDKAAWRQVDEHTVRPEAADKAHNALLRLKGIIEGMIVQEQKKLAQARERLHRARHGGGV